MIPEIKPLSEAQLENDVAGIIAEMEGNSKLDIARAVVARVRRDQEIKDCDLLADVQDFHLKFGLQPRRLGALLPLEFLRMRVKRLLEEVHELAQALARRDLVAATDASVDIAYINLGNAWLLNLPFSRAWNEVHGANMRKERAANPNASKYGSTFDIIKPKGWKAPNISQLLPEEDLALKVPEPKPEEKHDLIDYLGELEEHKHHEQATREGTQ